MKHLVKELKCKCGGIIENNKCTKCKTTFLKLSLKEGQLKVIHRKKLDSTGTSRLQDCRRFFYEDQEKPYWHVRAE